MTDKERKCQCADFKANGKCKHLYAVKNIIRVDSLPSNLVDPVQPPIVEVPKEKLTYPQDWSRYNAAQVNEKPHFMEMLGGLCEFVEDEPQSGPGRPRIPRSALLYLMIYKVYEQRSTRRFMSDADMAARCGYVEGAPHFNSIINGMNDEQMTQELHRLIEISSLPFAALEETFAADSSGFSVSEYERWQEIKPTAPVDDDKGMPKPKKKKGGKAKSQTDSGEELTERERQMWAKVHLICGVRTHIITAAVIKDRNASDPKQLHELIERTSRNFKIKRLHADKAYATIPSYQTIAKYGIDPFIPFKSNHSGAGKGRSGKEAETPGGKLWSQKYREFIYHNEEFEALYHVRSNVETVFSMIKRNVGAAVRSKSERAMLNEVLCKIVCHNILCIVKATYELGLETEHLRRPRERGWTPKVIDGGRASYRAM